jgi:AraC-like DNA-binding protein
LRSAATIDEFLAEPVGRCVAGDSWLYFYPRPALCGFLLWGRPVEDDLRRLTRVLAVELDPAVEMHASLVDVRRVEGIDPAPFAVLVDYVKANTVRLGTVVARLALVRSAGYTGALAQGFFPIVGSPYPVGMFEDTRAAATWLELPDATTIVDELEALHSAASGVSPLLRDLRSLLDREPGTFTLSSAARRLALSERSLQRQLGDLGTSFRREVGMGQVRVASKLMLEGDAKLSKIAHDVGCASLAHFSALFRKHMGASPSDWRAKRRA